MTKALLALEDGSVLQGEGIGTEGVSLGELVFTTSFTGYEEALTDPSYKGQNLMFTYPLIGNYGIHGENPQSGSIKAEGMVAREVCATPDHAKSRESINSYLARKNSRGITGVDTRELTITIRKRGTVKSAVAVGDYDEKEVLKLARNQPSITEKDLIPRVSTEEIEVLEGSGPTLALIDTGIKQSILTNFRERDFEILLFPHDVDPGTVKDYKPDGLFLTNGPGDPKRAKFKEMMESIEEKVAKSSPVNSLSEAKKAAKAIGLPLVVRPAYTLGGAGGGLAKTEAEFEEIVARGLKLSRIDQVLIEESVEGWKEFEYEVIRDHNDTCITIVNMENMDPMGIHTGESMVVVPSQTITDLEHQKLRSAAIKIIRKLGVKGGCNIQFALNSETGEYKVVEVNLDHKMVDTCAGEFRATTPYYYSTYEKDNGLAEDLTLEESKSGKQDKVLILGAGPIRIGQGIEFDYGCVHALEGLDEEGIETLMLNNNPETVSTDYDISDRLFFDPLTMEDVMNVIKKENPDGVIVQFGGQTSVNLAKTLKEELSARGDLKSEIYRTDPEMMDVAEDRDKFSRLLADLKIAQPENGIARTVDEAENLAKGIGFPVLVRPSYVLGGREMEVIYSQSELREYMENSLNQSPEGAILIDEFLENSTEIDVDAVSDGKDVLIGGVMEHIEQAGIHSGDSACVVPPQSIQPKVLNMVERYVKEIARSLEVVGLLNVQMAVREKKIYLLEANPRSSRTVPYLSKATGVPLAKLAAKIMAGKSLSEMDYSERSRGKVAVKEVVYPLGNLPGVDPILGPEMQSTGEVMGIAESFDRAFYKAQLAAENELPTSGTVLLSIKDEDKSEVLPIARELEDVGLNLLGTEGTASYLEERGVQVKVINKVSQGSPDILDRIDEIDLIINTPTEGEKPHRDGFKLRRAAMDLKIPYITNLQAAHAGVRAIKSFSEKEITGMAVDDVSGAS